MTRQTPTPAQPPWDRRILNDELFRRAPVPVGTHALVTHSAMLQDAAQMRDAAAYLRNALRGCGEHQESGDHDYRIVHIHDTARVKYERHAEFTDYTQVAAASGHTPFAQDADMVSTDWMSGLPGLRIAASKLHILPQDDEKSVTRAVASLSAQTASSMVADGQARIWADCRIQEDGCTRILVVDSGMPADRRARLVQRLLEIEDYRMLAMLGFVPAKSVMRSLQGMESQLQNLMTQVADSHTDNGQGSGEKILHQLLSLAAQVQQHSTDHTFRFDASRAYFALVNKRTRELREERIQGYQRLGYFLDRRLGPAMQTMEAVRGRPATQEQPPAAFNEPSLRATIASAANRRRSVAGGHKLLQPRYRHASGHGRGRVRNIPRSGDGYGLGRAPDHRLRVLGHSPDQQTGKQAFRHLMGRRRGDACLSARDRSG